MLETCCDLMVEAYERGLMTSRDGNVSLRYREQPFFYISPTDVRKHTLNPDQFKKLSVNLGENRTPVELPYTNISSNLRPSGEFPLHFLLQQTLPEDWDTRVVMHVHSTYTVAAMRATVFLHELREEFPEISRYTMVAPTIRNTPPVSWDLGEAVAKHLELQPDGTTKYNIVGIEGHGVVSVDKTPWRAYEHIERLEHICKIVLESGIYD